MKRRAFLVLGALSTMASMLPRAFAATQPRVVRNLTFVRDRPLRYDYRCQPGEAFETAEVDVEYVNCTFEFHDCDGFVQDDDAPRAKVHRCLIRYVGDDFPGG